MNNDKATIAYDTIKQQIINGEISDASYLSENALADQLAMSRTPVRTALYRLQQEGFLRIVPKQGIVLNKFSIDDAAQLFDFRMLVENHLINNALQALDSADIAHLTDIIEEQKIYARERDYENFLRCDQEFHMYCYHHYNNSYMNGVLIGFRERTWIWRYRAIRQEGRMEHAIIEHEGFLKAISEGKTALASELMREHAQHLERTIWNNSKTGR